MADPAFIPYEAYSFSEEEMKKRAQVPINNLGLFVWLQIL